MAKRQTYRDQAGNQYYKVQVGFWIPVRLVRYLQEGSGLSETKTINALLNSLISGALELFTGSGNVAEDKSYFGTEGGRIVMQNFHGREELDDGEGMLAEQVLHIWRK